ncbi:hypothetical protein FSP39_014947 [Pinctada imbricata]|uniref:C-type lectin domain-containing protein n=1 Tax=Pinctada imbricata TaxID=66713 RepID=A0AA88YEP5_PINIB|nr:hypothetical protein FSP39_014947 [Pinctada imbricata]
MLITSLILGNLILLAFSASTPKDKCMSMHVFQTTYNAVKEKIQEMNTLAERLKEKLDQSIDDTCESLANQGQLLQSSTTSNRYATRMVSPEFQPTVAYCIRFFYKTPYTRNYTGNFSIYLQEGADLGVPVWQKSIVTSNWTLGEFSPDPEYLHKPFKIVFEDKGNHYILIDDIMVYNVGCNSPGVRSPICSTNSYKRTDGQTTTCYTLHLEPLTWRDAILRCKEFWPLASLVSIETAAEDLFIRNIVANGTDLAAAADFGLWTRGNDIDKEGNFVWAENHGQPKAFSYSNWRSGQPNNIGDDQDCVLLQYPLTGLKWSDANCSEKHSFICEAAYSHVTGHSSIGNPFG